MASFTTFECQFQQADYSGQFNIATAMGSQKKKYERLSLLVLRRLCPKEFHWRIVSISSGIGLAPNRQQAIT